MKTTASKAFNAFEKSGVSIPKRRNMFNLSHRRLDTFNYGELIPIYLEETLPGDTFQIKQNHILRLTTLTKPLMDNLVYDTYYFYIPKRLIAQKTSCLDAFKMMKGENSLTYWENGKGQQSNIYYSSGLPSEGVKEGGLLDKLGAPIGSKSYINIAPITAYYMIYNTFFRDENKQKDISLKGQCFMQGGTYSKQFTIKEVDNGGSADNYYTNNSTCQIGLCYANKFKDYFTTCEQHTQRGDLGKYSFISNDITIESTIDTTNKIAQTDGSIINKAQGTQFIASGILAPGGTYTTGYVDELHTTSGEDISFHTDAATIPVQYYIPQKATGTISKEEFNSFDINELRKVWAIQNSNENLLRLGNRYDERLRWYWGVSVVNDLIDEPEYIGGMRSDVAIQQIAQTSGTTDNSPQANLAAYSQTNDSQFITTKTCKEEGYIMGIGVLRLNGHTYAQGINPILTKEDYTSDYVKEFENLGLQGIKNKEIYVSNDSETDEKIFGYQEIYNNYRYHPNEAHGLFNTSLDTDYMSWALTDNYTSTPILNASWLQENPSQLDRVLVIEHTTAPQVKADFYFNVTCTRDIALYSIPSKLF